MKSIASRQNAWFKRIRDALHHHQNEIAIEGPKAIHDALAQGWTPLALAASETASVPADYLGETLVFSAALFSAVSETHTTQGVIGLFRRPEFPDLFASRERLLVALDGVQDPGNVGTIVRLAAAFDAGGVILLPGCADAFGPKAIRASAGAILTVPVVNMTAVELLRHDWPLFAADAAGETTPPPTGGAVLLFGNEGSGVSTALASRAKAIAISISPRVESLNVAASAAILLAQSYARR